MEIKNQNYLNFYENEKFICFSMEDPIKTKIKNEQEKKIVYFPCGWQDFNDNSHCNATHNTFFIQTGQRSNITVVDIDDKNIYNDLLKNNPDLENVYTVETNKGVHLYFKYINSLKNGANINDIKGVDIRNDGGCVIAPPTKYKLLNGKSAKYKYVGGEILDIPSYLLNLLTCKKVEKKKVSNKKRRNLIMI